MPLSSVVTYFTGAPTWCDSDAAVAIEAISDWSVTVAIARVIDRRPGAIVTTVVSRGWC
ncbi:hypothetical protein ACFOZ7_10160 [Natribaculum luteum]|uniref:Uncharacterized protein n=1 Tax=Natribaculum luteum TaxID=1586232 RepID=A0ABD5NZ27_9EURY|nr:hypothetical protein [Natribaculum luteum]